MTPFAPPDPPPGTCVILGSETPLRLDCGALLDRVPMAYQRYGRLNAERSNLILVAHALSGDQVVAGSHPLTGRPGWWDRLVGPGRILDTERFCVLCANVIGGCMGSLGPASPNPRTGRPYGPDFPAVSIGDMVRLQAVLLDHLAIDDAFLVIGGSMGGMQALQWVRDHPSRVFAAAAFATPQAHGALPLALHAIGRRAIMNDPAWQGGHYYGTGRAPTGGLEVARMLAHLSYRAPEELASRFGRGREPDGTDLFQVESYLRHHGRRFLERFDPNSYLVITKAMDEFDLVPGGDFAAAFRHTSARIFLAAYRSDWLYPPAETEALAAGLRSAGLAVEYGLFDGPTGHDSFLLEVPEADAALQAFIDDCAGRRGL